MEISRVSRLLLAVLLSVVAVAGKLGAGLGVRRGRGIDRLTIGLGMTPRGEVGLIFAAVGATIEVDGKPLLSPGIYAALVATVFVTTLLAPPSLASRIRSRNLGGGIRVDSPRKETEESDE